jgi:L-ascorbate metabolism protein UlaG (beta-lactamase superfamily)
MGGRRILLDPWLVGSLMFGNAAWLFKSDRLTPRSIPENIDLILLSQGLEDHAHPATLKQLDRAIPVVGSLKAAKVVKDLGYTNVTALAHGEAFTLPEQLLEIKAVPGSPVGPTAIENGYILREPNGTSLYYEPHGYHSPVLKEAAPVDVVITPIIDLIIPVLGAVIKGQKGTLQVAQWLKPKAILPSAAGGDITFEGLLLKFLKAEGGAKEMRSLLAQNGMTADVIEPTPWERFEVRLA